VEINRLTEENERLRRELEQWTTDRYAWMMRAKKAEALDVGPTSLLEEE
jgi:hypothetical protein